jgi:hypothetical protein
MGRLAAGKDVVGLKEYFNFPLNTKQDLFSKVILEGDEMLITDIDQGWRQQLPENFQEVTGARSFMLGALRTRKRPLGVFYADRALSNREITAEDRRRFKQLVAQATLALRVR